MNKIKSLFKFKRGFSICKLLIFFLLMAGISSCSTYHHSVKKRAKNNHTIRKEKKEKKAKQKRTNLNAKAESVIREAYEWMGTKYEYGRQEKGKSTDCSGFVMVVFETTLGCKLPRNSAKQAEFCKHIKRNDIKPGDLVFFITNGGAKINHVGIMIDESQFIHASTNGVTVSSLEKPYYQKHLQKFGRVECLYD